LKIQIINGPNINLIGMRETSIYGSVGLDILTTDLELLADENDIVLDIFQSNNEGDIIDKIQQCNADFIIINPAGYTHTSVAIRDAFLAVNIEFIEIHISNIDNRESFRQKSFFSDIAVARMSGFGVYGYKLALLWVIEYLNKNK